MPKPDSDSERELRIARVLRPSGKSPLIREQAERAGQLLSDSSSKMAETAIATAMGHEVAVSKRGRLLTAARFKELIDVSPEIE